MERTDVRIQRGITAPQGALVTGRAAATPQGTSVPRSTRRLWLGFIPLAFLYSRGEGGLNLSWSLLLMVSCNFLSNLLVTFSVTLVTTSTLLLYLYLFLLLLLLGWGILCYFLKMR